MLLVEVGGGELWDLSFKLIVINRLLIGLEIITIMPVYMLLFNEKTNS